jgi:predicted unusual protein kinase regulating ubiquinone biosynthesis (AarF/ABC1/UbiB family)
MSESKYRRLLSHLYNKRLHTIIFTKPIQLFENLYNNEDFAKLELVVNKQNPTMIFDKNYKILDEEMNIFQSLISLYEDDFHHYYLPSLETIVKEKAIERANYDEAVLYIHSRKYNVTHALIDQSSF